MCEVSGLAFILLEIWLVIGLGYLVRKDTSNELYEPV